MAKNDNLKDFLTDVANAIRTKKGTTNKINPQDFSAEIASIETSGGGGIVPSRPTWTGHADAEGLKAIGWTDEDIAYYQENGVNWNAEDDEYHKVTDDNKALYGVLTAKNISTYKNRIVYLPKIDTSGKTDMSSMFSGCYCMVAMPLIDTSNTTNMLQIFRDCYNLVCIPLFDISKVTSMREAFMNCTNLKHVPKLNTTNVSELYGLFSGCSSLVHVPELDYSGTNLFGNMFNECIALKSIPLLDITNKSISKDYFVGKCYSLTHIKLKGLNSQLKFAQSMCLSKESLVYIINNENATESIIIHLQSTAYTRLSQDEDVIEALANHPNVSISQYW